MQQSVSTEDLLDRVVSILILQYPSVASVPDAAYYVAGFRWGTTVILVEVSTPCRAQFVLLIAPYVLRRADAEREERDIASPRYLDVV